MTGAIEANSSTAHDPGKYLGHDLIFVISQPRSGSTLLQRLLSGHSWIQTSAETWLMLHLSLIHISEPTRQLMSSRMPSSA